MGTLGEEVDRLVVHYKSFLKFDRSAAEQADSSNSPKCDKINLRTCKFWGNMLSHLRS